MSARLDQEFVGFYDMRVSQDSQTDLFEYFEFMMVSVGSVYCGSCPRGSSHRGH